MLIHLADAPPIQRLVVTKMIGHPYRLYSYFYWKRLPDPVPYVSKDPESTIMDSGLFSFMFGSEKGKMPETYDAYDAYTRNYLADLDAWGYRGFLVESDAQRLLGMPAVTELRKLFRDREDRTIFVWHEPEGLDGLDALALRYDYIAIGLPELRVISAGTSGGGREKPMRMVNDLLTRVHDVCRRKGRLPPKVHLLGCTTPRMMETRLAWSCDSTSWLNGVRYGTGYVWSQRDGLRVAGARSPTFLRYRANAMEKFPDAVAYANEQRDPDYYLNTMACAHAYDQYQQWLNTRFTPVPMRGTPQ
jgi:hypothetical protein